MTESKLKRLIVACSVGAVLLIVILISVMLYQIISMSVQKKRIDELDAKIAEYEQLIEEGEQTKETRSMLWWIEREARELGYVYEGDKSHNP